MKTNPETSGEPPDAVIQEVWKIKERLAREFNFDVHRIAADGRARQHTWGHPVISRDPEDVAVLREDPPAGS